MKRIFFTSILATLMLTASAEGEQNVTTYLTNPSFENGTSGWIISGLKSQSNSSFTKKSGAFYVEKWVSQTNTVGSASARQKLSGLPMGVYRLTAGAQNLSQSNTSRQCKGATLYAGDAKTAVYTPDDYSVEFKHVMGDIEIGFEAVGAEGNWLALDNFRLYRIGDLAVEDAKSELKKLLTSAQAIADNADGSGADELKAALAAAKTVYDNAEATVDQVIAAITALQQAVETYKYANPTGAIPTVTTDKRYARGATMAFGRLTVTANGASITERGFCWAENPEPTIFDYRTTSTLSGSSSSGASGTIYWLNNLQPATKYYMRAYAITKGCQVAYGDVIKFYTIPKGQIKLTMRDGGETEVYNRIKAAAQNAVDYWNNLTEMKDFNPSVGYASGTNTADCSYGGWVRVGPNSSYQRTGTMLHEFLHGVGVIPYNDTEWARFNLRSSTSTGSGSTTGSGNWLGDRATEVVRFLQNDNTAMLHGDYQHMWPFGINGADEDSGEELLYIANGLVCQALGEDGLQHTSTLFAEPYYALDQEDEVKYYIKNESTDRGLYTSYLKPTSTGALKWVTMSAAEAASNDSTAWYITFTPSNQYYQFRNAATGQYMTYSSGIRTATKASLTANDNWHLMKGRVDVSGQRGYWIIHPEANWTPKCLQAGLNGATSTATFNIANSAEAQRWLIMTAEAMKETETTAITQYKKQVNDALQRARNLLAVPHTEDVAGTDNTLTATISSLESQVAATTSIPELVSLSEQAEQATLLFLQGVTPTADPFDLTYLLVNPTIDENCDGWSTEATINYGCGEFYQKTFDFNQTVKNLPAGNYAFAAQGFQRPGPYSSASSVAVNATIYAGSKSQKIHHIKDDSQTTKVGIGGEQTMNGKYIPDNMQSAAAYFAKGLYANSVSSSVATTGNSLKMGIRSTSMGSGYWVIFDNFHLYFYGSKSSGDVTAVKGIVDTTVRESRQVFDLQGRQVALPSKGLYIINGRKVVIK